MKKVIIIKKAAIKIVKRYKEAASEKIVAAPQMSGGAKAEINVERAMAGTISGWISERCANRQAEEVFAMSRISAWKNSCELLRQS